MLGCSNVQFEALKCYQCAESDLSIIYKYIQTNIPTTHMLVMGKNLKTAFMIKCRRLL